MTESVDSPSRVDTSATNSAAPPKPAASTPPNGKSVAQANLTKEEQLAIEHMVTEDDTPVDNWFSEKQRRLLTHPLYASWQGPGEGRPFIAASAVGVFRSPLEPPLVPDVFLSLDVQLPQDWWSKPNRVYAIWEYKKPPDIVIEVVSNRVGGEAGGKLDRYASFGVPCYVIFDPHDHLKSGMLSAFERNAAGLYAPCSLAPLPVAGLSLKLWRGVFEGREDTWLRWHDDSGELILTGAERAERAEERIERLTAQLRAHGIVPHNGSSPP